MEKVYPEVGAGGFSRVDGTVQFYTRVNALLAPGYVMVNLGAGRGRAFHNDPIAYRRELQNFRGKAGKVIGLDIDPIVLENPSLDAAYVIGADGRFPLDDASADIIVSDYTFEHVEDADTFCAEIDRILKPGAWLCARTPNKWSYVSLGANLVPNRFHVALLKILQPERKAVDVFPTHYRLNSPATLRDHFPSACWDHHNYIWNPEPAYFGNNVLVWRMAGAVIGILPSALGATLNVFLRKRGQTGQAGG